MPSRYIVTHFKGNEPKVHVFSFPKDKTLSDMWTCNQKNEFYSN